jgi:hypothetical protein
MKLVKFYINEKVVCQYFFPGNYSVENKLDTIDDLKNKMREFLSKKLNISIDEIKKIERFDIIKW